LKFTIKEFGKLPSKKVIDKILTIYIFNVEKEKML
jgi:hypothetical protein